MCSLLKQDKSFVVNTPHNVFKILAKLRKMKENMNLPTEPCAVTAICAPQMTAAALTNSNGRIPRAGNQPLMSDAVPADLGWSSWK